MLEIRPQEKLFSRHFLLKHNQKVSEVSTETSSWMKFSGFRLHFFSSFTFRDSGHLLDILLSSQFHSLHFPASQGAALCPEYHYIGISQHLQILNRTPHMVKMNLTTISPEQSRHSRNCRPGCYKSKCILLPLLESALVHLSLVFKQNITGHYWLKLLSNLNDKAFSLSCIPGCNTFSM